MNEVNQTAPKGFLARGGQWPLLVVALLGVQIVLCMAALYYATSDKSFAVEPDAYQKALAWDDQVAAQKASDELGWTLALTATEPDAMKQRYVVITLADSDNQPIEGAQIAGTTLHPTEASRPRALEFTEIAPGQYRAPARMKQDGKWLFDLRAERGEDVFLWRDQQFIGQWRME